MMVATWVFPEPSNPVLNILAISQLIYWFISASGFVEIYTRATDI